MNAHLAVLESKDEMEYVADFIITLSGKEKYIYNGEWWVGARLTDDSTAFKWVDGSGKENDLFID